jgi:hypothetical protein
MSFLKICANTNSGKRGLFLITLVFCTLNFIVIFNSAAAANSIVGVWKKYRDLWGDTNKIKWQGDAESRVFYPNGTVKYFTNNVKTQTYSWYIQGDQLYIGSKGSKNMLKGTLRFTGNDSIAYTWFDKRSNRWVHSYYWRATINRMYNFANIKGNWSVYKYRDKNGKQGNVNWQWTIDSYGRANFSGKQATLELAGCYMMISYSSADKVTATFVYDKNSLTIRTPNNTYWLSQKPTRTVQAGGYGLPVYGKVNTGDAYLKPVRKDIPKIIYGRWYNKKTNKYWQLNKNGVAYIDTNMAPKKLFYKTTRTSASRGNITFWKDQNSRPSYGSYEFAQEGVMITLDGEYYFLTPAR